MPPKTLTQLEKIKAQLAQKKQSRKVPSIKRFPAKKVTGPPRARDIAKRAEEEFKIKEFFMSKPIKRIKKITDKRSPEAIEILQQIKEFTTGSDATAIRKALWEELRIMPFDMLQQFIKEYRKQDVLTALEYARKLKTAPKTTKRLRKILEKVEAMEEVEEAERDKERRARIKEERLARLEQKEFGGLFGDDEEAVPIIEDVAYPDSLAGQFVEKRERLLGPKLKTKLVDIGMQEITIPERELLMPFPTVDRRCMDIYDRLPWIDGGFGATFWLSAPLGEELDMTYITQSGFPEDTKEDQGRTWYRATKKFRTDLLCGINRERRRQDGLNYILFDNDNIMHKFMLAFETKDGKFIVQDENVFAKEQDWFRSERKSVKEHLDDILAQPINDSVRHLGVELFRQYMSTYDPVELESQLYTVIGGGTIKDYLTRLADLVVFLEPDINYAQIFRKRIENHYFIPDVLFTLTLDEKMPEVFDDPRVSDEVKKQVADFMARKLDDFIDKQSFALYRLRDPTARRADIAEPYVDVPQVNLPPPRTEFCKKEGADEWELVFYEDDGNVFCFSIQELLKQFEEGNYNNSGTDKRFTQEFIEKIQHYRPPNAGFPAKVEKPEVVEVKTHMTATEYMIANPEWTSQQVDDMCKTVKIMEQNMRNEQPDFQLNIQFIDTVLNKVYKPHLYLETFGKPLKERVPPEFLELVKRCLGEEISQAYAIPFWKKLISMIEWEQKHLDEVEIKEDIQEYLDKEEEEELAPKLMDIAKQDIMDLENEMIEEKEDKLVPAQPKSDMKRQEPMTEEDICTYCKNHLNPTSSLKSIIKHKSEARIVKFCNTECFDKEERVFKKRKSKGNKKE